MSRLLHLAHRRSGEPACRSKDPLARRTGALDLVSCEACRASKHFALWTREARKKEHPPHLFT